MEILGIELTIGNLIATAFMLLGLILVFGTLYLLMRSSDKRNKGV